MCPEYVLKKYLKRGKIYNFSFKSGCIKNLTFYPLVWVLGAIIFAFLTDSMRKEVLNKHVDIMFLCQSKKFNLNIFACSDSKEFHNILVDINILLRQGCPTSNNLS